MKSQNVLAEVRVDSRQVSAHFRPSTGRLVIIDGTAIVEAIRAPDSWMALATVNSGSNWGTRPTPADLRLFLERYVARHPRFKQLQSKQDLVEGETRRQT